MNFKFLASFLILLLLQPLIAAEITITAKSLNETSDLLINDDFIESLYQDDFEDFDLFNNQESTLLLQSGTSNKGLQIKGADSSQIAVYQEGIKLNDPMSPSGSFNFSEIDPSLTRKIKIISAGATTLYGQGTTGAIVKIIPDTYLKRKTLSLLLGYGSYRTSKFQGKYQNKTSVISLSRSQTQGLSSARVKDGSEADLDGEKRTSISIKKKINLIKNYDLEVLSNINHINTELDNGAGSDDPNNHSESFNYALQSKARTLLFNDLVEANLKLSRVYYHRRYLNSPDNISSTDSNDKISSSNNEVELSNHLLIDEKNTGILGLHYEYSHGKVSGTSDMPKKGHKIFSPYFFYKLTYPHLELSSGVRFFESNITDDLTKEINLKLLPYPNTLWFSFSAYSAIKYPSIYQLYSSYGDENLKTEESNNYEVSLSTKYNNQTFTLNYFKKKFNSLIDFDMGTMKYQNLNHIQNNGWVIGLTNRFGPNYSLYSSIIFLKSRDLDTGEQLIRRPKTKGNISFEYHNIKTNMKLGFIYVGKRTDTSNTSLPSYTLINFVYSLRLQKRWKLFTSLNNIMDRDYEQIAGYTSPGRNFFIGVNYKI